MDLREVLAEVFHPRFPHRPEWCDVVCLPLADAALARLSRPDVLDEVQRRCEEAFDRTAKQTTFRGVECSPVFAARAARRVLSDMLGGGS